MNTVLVLSPHPDDGWLSSGATIARFLEEKKEVYYAIFSWTDQGFTWQEIQNALDRLGIKRSNVYMFDYKVRNFPEQRQQILEDLIKLREKLDPDLILCHSFKDRHEDHEVVAKEAFRAFKEQSIWGYELPWNMRDFKSDIFVSLTRKQMEKKISA